VLHSLGITADDITQLKTEAAALIETLRHTPAYKATRGIRNSMDFHEFIERGASKIDSVESSTHQTVEQKNPESVRQYVDAHPHSDRQITGQLAASAILVLAPLAIPAQYGWLGVLTLSSGLIGSLTALIAWNARVQLHWDTISREYHSKLDLEIADLQEKRALLMAGWPGMCFRLRELVTAAHQKSQVNDSLRGQWVRLCENGNCSLPSHMVGNNTGPSPIAELLTQLLHLFQPETGPPPKQAIVAKRSAATEDATASVVNILARSLIAVAVADGRIRAEEVATITNGLIELGTEGDLARSAVKQCISELRGGTLPLDFIKAAIGVASKFKGTSFGQNILDMQRSVAQSDGGVSANEHKVLDAFQRGLS
jgi:tellurite resistance protein